ncbi:MAG TPA: hypothetical protein VFX03_16450, partial [Thermomicrobiales bacterium]|nr:hypothetical protein [Thermomicrobiales bacterium]
SGATPKTNIWRRPRRAGKATIERFDRPPATVCGEYGLTSRLSLWYRRITPRPSATGGVLADRIVDELRMGSVPVETSA